MSVDRKEIDLIIRAALQGGKTLESVSKSIADIEKALDAQTAAAKRGESSIDELKATLLALQRVQDQLKDQAGLISQYDKLAKQIEKTAASTAKANQTYTEYKAKVEAAGKATDFQRDKLVKLANASERNEATLARQRLDQQALTVTLQEAGIAIDNLTGAETRARQSAAQLGVQINRTQQAIASYSEDVRKAREEQRKLSADATFQKQLEDAAKLNKASEYVRFWSNALQEADLAQQQVQINTALRKTADEAVAAARGYKTLGTASKSLVASSGGLRETILGITQPAEQARQTLAGVENQVRQIGTAVSAIKGPISDYRNQVKQLAEVQRSIANQAGIVDAYQQQVATLRSARAEYVQARAQVLQYAEALRQSSGANTQLEASLRSAQAALTSAQANLGRQVAATRQMRESMAQAGISTRDLASAQSRLIAAAQTGTTALRQLELAHKRYGDAARDAKNAQDVFADSGRTTLSVLQRIRGQVLSVIAAYVGLYGAVNGASKVIDAFKDRQATQNKLAIAVGNNTQAIGEAYEYIRGQADRIGLDFSQVSGSFSKFAASAKLAGRSTEEVKYIFESFAEVGTTLSLSGEKMEKVFYALEQMMSKGKIGSEELRQQLGDALPGAFGVFQKALKDKFPDLDKAMKEGKVSVDNLVLAAEEYRKMVANRLPSAMNSLQARQNRLNNTILDFKLAIADSGFIDAFSEFIAKLTEVLKSDDGKKFAQELSKGLVLIVEVLQGIVENANLIKEVLIVGVLAFGATSALKFALALGSIPAQLAAVQASAVAAGGSILAIRAAMASVAAFAAGWAFGAWLREEFAIVRKGAAMFVVGWITIFTTMKYGTLIIWEEIQAAFSDGMAAIGNLLTKGFRDLLSIFAAGARALGRNDLADSLDKAMKSIEFRTDRIGTASAKLRKELQSELKKIREIGLEMLKEADSPGSSAPKSKAAVASPTGKPTPNKGAVAIDKEAAEKRLKVREQLEDALRGIEQKIAKSEKENLESRLKAIDLEYAELLRKIQKFGGAESKALEARFTSAVNELKMREILNFNAAMEKEQEALQKKLEQIDAQAGRNAKTDLDARLNAVRLQYADTYREIEDFQERLAANNQSTAPAEAMKKRLDLGVAALQNLERQKYFEDATNAILEERKAKLDTIAVMEKNGLLTATQARERAAEVVTQTQPKIEAVVAEGLKYVEVMLAAAEATGANTTALETLRAKLLEAQNSAKGLRTELFSAAQINEMLANGATTAFESMAESIGGAIAGMNSWQDAIQATRNAFLKFAADFLMEMGKMIAKKALLEAFGGSNGSSSSGGAGGWISTLLNSMFTSGKFHSGGIVGSGGTTTLAHASWFANAPRYHGGGIAGLAPDEYPAILKKNEEVLTQNDPRNVLNGGAAGGAAATNLKVINMIDSASVVSEGLATQQGEKAIFNFIRANRTGLKQILG